MLFRTIIVIVSLLSLFQSQTVLAQSTKPVTQPATKPATKPVATQPVFETAIPTTPGDHKLKFRTVIDGRTVEMAYLLYLPVGYDKTSDHFPMVVFLHGSGECGTDLAGVYVHGPMAILKEGVNPAFRDSCPFIVLCPQCPPHGERWDQDIIIKTAGRLLDDVIEKVRVDPDRVSCTGLSMGGLGTWHLALDMPDRFAAIAPISAVSYLPGKAARVLKYVAVWATTGKKDTAPDDGSERMTSEIAARSCVEVTHLSMIEGDHGVWPWLYNSPQFYEWLLSKHRPSAAERKTLDEDLANKNDAPAPLPTAPGHHLLYIDTKIGEQPMRLDYLLYIPHSYKSTGPKSPAMVFLHESDDIGSRAGDLYLHGLDKELENNPALAQSFPFVVISPLRPINTTWDQPATAVAVVGLMDTIQKNLNIDAVHQYITGLDAGALGAWDTAISQPDRFAAVAPVLVHGDFAPNTATSGPLKSTPIWISVSKSIAAASSVDALAHEFPMIQVHSSAKPSYAGKDMYDWLLAQSHVPVPTTNP